MSELSQPAQASLPSICRLPVDKPQLAAQFLHDRGGGVMDLIAHFWERLPQTPPLLRNDLHLVVTCQDNNTFAPTRLDEFGIPPEVNQLTGAMLYVPKAHRADVLALDPPAASAFVRYIAAVGQANNAQSDADFRPIPTESAAFSAHLASIGNETTPKSPPAKLAIDFLTGGAEGIQFMVPQLLPLVNKRSPARQLINIVMQLPVDTVVPSDSHVRLARDADIPALNRWRKLYKEERGILFDADVDAWVDSEKIFVFEENNQVVAIAKFDLELNQLIEIGGVFTFPEFRQLGFAAKLVADLALRIRALGKTPTLQVDRENTPALSIYQKQGWIEKGSLARVWLTG